MRKMNQIEALKRIKKGESIADFEIVFNAEKVEALDALLLGENNILVPEDLIFYEDDEIDFSDNPDIADSDFESGRLVESLSVKLKTREDISEWIKTNNVNLDVLATKLIEDFYDNMQVVKVER
ncbi:MAG: hypothetical protein C7N36_21765 [Bacteroidetes bacterium]|nr:MAG: hypothetical protein C7N36_21765 [Bacteroidota bacterium]